MPNIPLTNHSGGRRMAPSAIRLTADTGNIFCDYCGGHVKAGDTYWSSCIDSFTYYTCNSCAGHSEVGAGKMALHSHIRTRN